ncbi:MAG: general secretion pathway protein GspB [Methylococcaceae bacterium]|nr:general secretion pathway protein GspB [Methylococcaceae bacterium]
MAYKKSFFLIVGLLYNIYCFAEFRDPTKPASYFKNTGVIAHQSKQLNLSSIWISGDSKRATINGVTAQQGDFISPTIKVLKIESNSVLIKQKGKTKKLSLFSHSFKSQ